MRDSSEARFRAPQAQANRRGAREQAWFVQRPDRVALWAFLMAVFAAVVALASSAEAGSGGVDATAASTSASWKRSVATWYGPGFFGNQTACGQKLKPGTVGVAHKRLPCGTKVAFRYRGRVIRTRVIDRGPYANHARWDLTQAAARQLRFKETDNVRAAVLKRR